MQVYLEKTGSIIMHIDLYFVQIKAIFTVFKNFIIYTVKSLKLMFLENLLYIISKKNKNNILFM